MAEANPQEPFKIHTTRNRTGISRKHAAPGDAADGDGDAARDDDGSMIGIERKHAAPGAATDGDGGRGGRGPAERWRRPSSSSLAASAYAASPSPSSPLRRRARCSRYGRRARFSSSVVSPPWRSRSRNVRYDWPVVVAALPWTRESPRRHRASLSTRAVAAASLGSGGSECCCRSHGPSHGTSGVPRA